MNWWLSLAYLIACARVVKRRATSEAKPYSNLRDHAVVSCLDEKSKMQSVELETAGQRYDETPVTMDGRFASTESWTVALS